MATTTGTYHEITILSCASGFGEYEAGPEMGEGWGDLDDLLQEIRANIPGDLYELGVDDLPDEIEDIRGLIHNEPTSVYAYLNAQGQAEYVGIEQL